MSHTIVAGLVILAITAVPALASNKRSASTRHTTDQQFVLNAANASIAQIELGKIAEMKSGNEEVKGFAKSMVADHERALDDLKRVAMDQQITLPTALDAKDKALKDRLETLSGLAFDRAYMGAMVKNHRSDVAEFRTEAKSAKGDEVKQYASRTLSTLEEHLKRAQEIDHSIGATGRQSKTS
jgi:putative membrane protein